MKRQTIPIDIVTKKKITAVEMYCPRCNEMIEVFGWDFDKNHLEFTCGNLSMFTCLGCGAILGQIRKEDAGKEFEKL